jgi:hypothetical protein
MGFKLGFRFDAMVKDFPKTLWRHTAYFDSDEKAQRLAKRLSDSGMFLCLDCTRENADGSFDSIRNEIDWKAYWPSENNSGRSDFRFDARVKHFPTVEWLYYARFNNDEDAIKFAERLVSSGIFLTLDCVRTYTDESGTTRSTDTIWTTRK